MDANEFITAGRDTIDLIAGYHASLGERPVLSDVEPGYLRKVLPAEAPQDGEAFEAILSDVQTHIIPGLTNWMSPSFAAYYPCRTSYPAMLGALIANAVNVVGLSWLGSPVATELEAIILDWFGKMAGLPEQFLFYNGNGEKTGGGGVFEETASDAMMLTELAARQRGIARAKQERPDQDDHLIVSKFVAYTSDQAHFSVAKTCTLAMIKLRLVKSDKFGCMRGAELEKLLKEDQAAGLIPVYICATLGTTGTCAFDCLEEIGPLAREVGAWLHVDSAYSGGTFVCPEYRHWLKGVEFADSISINAHKSLPVAFGMCMLWLQSQVEFTEPFDHTEVRFMPSSQRPPELIADYRYFQVALGRRFKAIQLWFALRSFGVSGMQQSIRESVSLAEQFAEHVRSSELFEIPEQTPPQLGLVCFRLKGNNDLNTKLLSCITATRKLFIVSTIFAGQVVLRYASGSVLAKADHVDNAWKIIVDCAQSILAEESNAK